MQSQKEQVEFMTLILWQSHARSADKLGVGGHWYTRHVSPSVQLSNEIVEKTGDSSQPISGIASSECFWLQG